MDNSVFIAFVVLVSATVLFNVCAVELIWKWKWKPVKRSK